MRTDSTDAKNLRQARSRDAAFIRTHQINGGEPFMQWQFRVLEYGAGGDRGLMSALGALMKVVTAQHMGLIVSAARALDAVRPTMPFQLFQTGLLCAESGAPIQEISRFLLHICLLFMRI